MGLYIENVLLPDEKIIYEGEFALIDNWFWIVISLGLFLIPIYLIQKTNEVAVTNERVICKEGIIWRNTTDYSLDSIERVDVEQTILGRIFNFGDIIIYGTGGSEKKIKGLKDPEKLKQAINNAKYSKQKGEK